MDFSSIERGINLAIDTSPIPYRIDRTDGPTWTLVPAEPLEIPTFRVRVSPFVGDVRIDAHNEPYSARFVGQLYRSAGSADGARRGLNRDLPVGARVVGMTWEKSRVDISVVAGALGERDASDATRHALSAVLSLFESAFVVHSVIGQPAAMRTSDCPRSQMIEASYDSTERDQAGKAHADLENLLIEWLDDHGLSALDPSGGIEFDLAWQTRLGAHVVCEVKSLGSHPDKQLRLGAGQVIHYAALLRRAYPRVEWIPVLAVTAEPPDAPLWSDALLTSGIVLAWPSILAAVESTLLDGVGALVVGAHE